MAKRQLHLNPEIAQIKKVELHQHLDGSIPINLTWRLMKKYGLNPVATQREMERLLVLQEGEEGALLRYLDKFHYPQWITQFYENITAAVEAIIREAYHNQVTLIELRYAPMIHIYAGLTPRQAISAVLAGMNRVRRKYPIEMGLIIIAMRQQGPHIAQILARQAISESQRFHARAGVIGFDVAGAERGHPARLFREAFDVARAGGLGLTIHAGEDEGPEVIWEALDVLGARRIGHGCSAVKDKALLRRLAKDQIVVECCYTSNYQTGAVSSGAPHPILTFLEYGIPVAICTDNTTVSNTSQNQENQKLSAWLEIKQLREIHDQARHHSFLHQSSSMGAQVTKGRLKNARTSHGTALLDERGQGI